MAIWCCLIAITTNPTITGADSGGRDAGVSGSGARNPFGFIGGIDEHCFDDAYLRNLIRDVAPEKATKTRPFRLGGDQLWHLRWHDLQRARRVIDKIGHLCDYILLTLRGWACETVFR